jgi:hypothetical protein
LALGGQGLPDVVEAVAYVLFALGSLVSGLNFYLSFLRYPLYKLLGRRFRWVSGFPLVGSLSLVVSVVLLRESPLLFWGGIIIALLDTGGLHWFAGVMVWSYLFRRR